MNTASFQNFDEGEHLRFVNPSIVEKDLRTLVSIFEGINSDGLVNDIENKRIYEWINSLKIYETKQPYKDIIDIIRYSLSDGILTKEEADNIVWFCNQYIEKTNYYTQSTAGLQKLTGLLKGISIDDQVNDKEINYLNIWLEEHAYLQNHYPYDEIYSLVTKVLRDGVITTDEKSGLLDFCRLFADDDKNTSNENLVTLLNTGFYQIDPDIKIQENNFCITGLSRKYKRREIAEKIELYGGFINNSITKSTNYLVVCDEKNSCWAFTCYGKKIEEAIKLRKNGQQLAIIHEFDLYDKFESLNL